MKTKKNFIALLTEVAKGYVFTLGVWNYATYFSNSPLFSTENK